MRWKEGLLDDSGSRDMTVGRHFCVPCNLTCKPTESRAIRKGKKLAESGVLKGAHALDKRVTSMSLGNQLGYLRARQHCATCGNNMGEPCTCKGKCNCLYCKIERGEEE
jgi:hypothetical protein